MMKSSTLFRLDDDREPVLEEIKEEIVVSKEL